MYNVSACLHLALCVCDDKYDDDDNDYYYYYTSVTEIEKYNGFSGNHW